MSNQRRIQTKATKMKTLKDHINEALKIGKNLSEWSSYSCQPKTRTELKEIIEDRISKEGQECELNDIDTSLIENMSYLFAYSRFNGDISKWDVSNVIDMFGMFSYSKFNGDISMWNVSNVEDMRCMFNVSFFNQDISKWNINRVKDMRWMFQDSKFNQNISKWKINKDCITHDMFLDCSIKEEYKPKLPR